MIDGRRSFRGMSHDLFTGKKGHTPASQVVEPAVEHASHLGQLIEVFGERVTNE